MPKDVLDVTKQFMRDPVKILVKKEELTLEGIKQFYIQVEREVSDLIKFVTLSSFSIKSHSWRLFCYNLCNLYTIRRII